MSYNIEYIDINIPQPEWDIYIQNNYESMIFHRLEWLKVISDVYKYAVYACVLREAGTIRGVCPLVHLKTPFFGNALISTAFGTGGGILADAPDIHIELQNHIEQLARTLNVDYAECRSRTIPTLEAEKTVGRWKAKAATYAGFDITLSADPKDRMQQFRKKKRNEVRKALQNNLTVEYDVPVDVFYKVYSESLRDHGTPPHTLKWYKNIVSAFGKDAQTMLVSKDNQPLSACIALYYKNSVTPYYSGGLKAARPAKAFDVMYWSLMQHAVEREHFIFDFGRSKLGTGAADYKIYWGFEAKPLEYQYYMPNGTDMPDINPNNPKYATFVQLWQHLPLCLANTVGPLLARQLG